jgi:hypothetical protein
VHGSGKTGNGGAEHHAFGAEIDDARFFIDQQAQGRQRQNGAGAEGGAQQQCIGFHGSGSLHCRNGAAGFFATQRMR